MWWIASQEDLSSLSVFLCLVRLGGIWKFALIESIRTVLRFLKTISHRRNSVIGIGVTVLKVLPSPPSEALCASSSDSQ